MADVSRVGSTDRRVRRSRRALMDAAVRLVSARGTTDIAVTELAEAADVSRRVLYQHFGDRDSLIAAAAASLFEELKAETDPAAGPVAPDVTRRLVELLLEHQAFYRAVFGGRCMQQALVALVEFFRPLSASSARELFGDLEQSLAEDVGDYFTGATTTALVDWLVRSPSPDPDEFIDRMVRIRAAITCGHQG